MTSKNVLGFGLVTSRNNQYPVLCRAIRGSRSDTLTVQDMLHQLKAWGFHHLTLILDRGMISRENVQCVVDSGFDVVGLVPETHKEAWSYVVIYCSLAKPAIGKTAVCRRG
jgi:transposase